MQIPKHDRIAEFPTDLWDVSEFRYYKKEKLVYILKFCKSLYEYRKAELISQASLTLLNELKDRKFDPTICGIK